MTRGSSTTLFTVCTCVVFAIAAVAAHGEPSQVTVATVQFRVEEATYSSVGAYRAAVERVVERAVDHYDADIIVFPEYLNVFLIASRFPEAVEQASTVEEAAHLAVGRPGDGGDRRATGLPALLRLAAAKTAGQAIGIWQELAASYEVTIVAGTFFVPPEEPHEPGLRNRLIVFDRTGEILYEQDKVYLTEEERRDLGIRPGSLAEAEPVELAGITAGFTICRDSFFDSWHEPLDGIEVWFDLRANGEPFSREVEERFRRTLPRRVRDAQADAGVNATLTGSFLDLLWEGRSYIVDDSGRRVAESRRVAGTEITAVTLIARGDSWQLERRGPQNGRP